MKHKDLTHLLGRQDKHMWLVVRQLLMRADWWDAPLTLWDLAKAIHLNSLVPTLCNRFPSCSFTSITPWALRRISDFLFCVFLLLTFHFPEAVQHNFVLEFHTHSHPWSWAHTIYISIPVICISNKMMKSWTHLASSRTH